jgi:acyl carrier protein
MSSPLHARIKQVIVTSLRLTIRPEEIGDEVPLFGEGLGLDSIDALELVLEIERTFGVSIGDDQLGKRVLRTVSSIAEYIESQTQARTS